MAKERKCLNVEARLPWSQLRGKMCRHVTLVLASAREVHSQKCGYGAAGSKCRAKTDI